MPLPASPQPAPGPARPVAVTETGLLGTPVKIPPHGCNSGALLGRLGVLVQALLATAAFSTLMLKRFQEPKEERRPWRIWFYDTSKQAIGALFIHFANVFLSGHTAEDPCSLQAGLSDELFAMHQRSQNDFKLPFPGDPPQAAAWIGQCILYLLIMVFEKTVVSLALFIPGWTKLQEILLDYIPDPQLELVLVMFIVPFTVNAVMFWVVDSLIMRKYKQTDSLEGSRSIENPVRNEESQALLCPDLDFDQSESDEDLSGLQGPSQKMRQPGYQVVL
ncbi:store-operated calcium entry regulator STIMATE-like [Terrapene carolina triunguis]|uniref:store-operated calcium entry regulator STIMATE-like n=1 Tax=Terrapene triunguis TaxID=2587831 RepID=UPI0011567287|nr:store-operated calcium entry regulator STIMATE-like [Terrapene carolina triunguis]